MKIMIMMTVKDGAEAEWELLLSTRLGDQKFHG
jgi:hypothetical protein